ncbi:MAG: ABC transporter ATP-binding protein [Firmicutes bacterium]|nr:ABC transporter ATP-binding protein [Bacillota bacterium]
MGSNGSNKLHPIVELQRVCKHYPGEPRMALEGVDLAIYPGDFLAVLGPSGAGKTTLLHILGLLDRPSQGRVLVKGKPTDGLSEQRRAQLRHGLLGFVFQFHYLLPDLTVWDNVLLPLLITEQGRSSAPKVEQMLASVGLLEKARNYPNQLSGGERQRVAVARALVTRPPLLLADEPTGNLDTVSATRIWDLLTIANKQYGTAVVAITHNEELAKKGTRLVRIVDGVIEG